MTPFQQFGNTPGKSPFCGQTITISYGGKSTSAQVVDKVDFFCHPIYQLFALSLPSQCPGCPPRGLDLTEGLFKFFAPLGAGVIYGTWSGGGGDAPKAPTTSYTPPPSPTTHYEPPSSRPLLHRRRVPVPALLLGHLAQSLVQLPLRPTNLPLHLA